jgi:hypothetical protein
MPDPRFEKWAATTDEGQPRYERQTEILRQALDLPGRSLDGLLHQMRTGGESAIYLCGSRLDNDFALGSHDLAALLSVLPQAGRKAAEPGYHPGSTEVHIVFQGSPVIESLIGNSLESVTCGQFSVVVLPPGQCHRVRYEAQQVAASFIVKTNPGYDPKVIRCGDCVRFSDKAQCPLHRSWEKDRERTGI